MSARAAPLVRDPALAITVAALWALLALFVVYPLADAARAQPSSDEGRPALGPLLSVLHKPGTSSRFLNSLLLGTLVGIIGTALGFLFAFTVEPREPSARAGSRVIDAVTCCRWSRRRSRPRSRSSSRSGRAGSSPTSCSGIKGVKVYGLSSTLAAEVLTYFPIAYLTLRPVLAAIDSNLEGMAFSLGSSRCNVFRTVTLPLAHARPRQRVPAAVRGVARRFRDAADPRRQLVPGAADEAYLQITGLFDLTGGAALSFAAAGAGRARLFCCSASGSSARYYVTITGKARRADRPSAASRPRCAGVLIAGLRSRSRCSSSTSTRCCCTPRWSSPSAPTTPDARALPRDLHRRPQGDQRHADHRADRHAARRLLRRAARLSRRAQGVRRAAARWRSCR